MAFCVKCGSQLEDDSRFCPVCGHKVRSKAVSVSSEVIFEPGQDPVEVSEPVVAPPPRAAVPVRKVEFISARDSRVVSARSVPRSSRSGHSAWLLGLGFIVVGLIFTLLLFSPFIFGACSGGFGRAAGDVGGQFGELGSSFGELGSRLGEAFGNLGERFGDFFGNFGDDFGDSFDGFGDDFGDNFSHGSRLRVVGVLSSLLFLLFVLTFIIPGIIIILRSRRNTVV